MPQLQCPDCKHRYEVPDSHARLECPRCMRRRRAQTITAALAAKVTTAVNKVVSQRPKLRKK